MRVNSKWLVVMLILGAVSLSGCNLPVVQKLRARDYLNKGVTQFTNQKFDAAAQFFQRSLELDPGFEIARQYLATAYMSQFVPQSSDPRSLQMADLAIRTFEEVLANAPEPNINAMLSIASLYYNLDKFDESKEWCDKILEVDPNNAEAYYRVAVMEYDFVHERTGLQGDKVADLSDEEISELRARVETGLDYIANALKSREGYFEAMEYQNFLWREKAKLETDEDARIEVLYQADIVARESSVLRRKAQEEAARKPKTAKR